MSFKIVGKYLQECLKNHRETHFGVLANIHHSSTINETNSFYLIALYGVCKMMVKFPTLQKRLSPMVHVIKGTTEMQVLFFQYLHT